MTRSIGWSRLQAPPPLRHDEVHLWRIRLDQPGSLEAAAVHLSPDERARAARFCFVRDRRRFTGARAALRAILGAYLMEDAERIRFRLGPHGKPSIASPCGDRLCFNLSHSGELALCAVAWERELGVDVEAVRPLPDAAAIAERYFSCAERAALRRLAPGEQLTAFFRCWTRKEAYLKALGDGLARPLDGFSVSLAPGAPPRLLSVQVDPDEVWRWSFTDPDPGSGYVAALAASGQQWQLLAWEWAQPGGPVAVERMHGAGRGRESSLQGGRERRGAILNLAGGPGDPRWMAGRRAIGTEVRVSGLHRPSVERHAPAQPASAVGRETRPIAGVAANLEGAS